jgi:hypothetical protein
MEKNEKFEAIQEAIKGLDKTLGKLKTLLEDEEDFEEDMDPALVLLQKYQTKVEKAILVLDPEFLNKQAQAEAEAQQQAKAEAEALSPPAAEGGLKKTDYEFFPNSICITIHRSLGPLKIPEPLEMSEEEQAIRNQPMQGPFIIVTEVNGVKASATYIGQISDEKQQGIGRMVYNDGTILEGEWKEGLLDGYGRIISWDGVMQEGYFVKGVIHGKGKRKTYPQFIGQDRINQTYYEGDFEEGQMTGKGKKTYYDGNYYEGEFLNGQRHGHGMETYHSQKAAYEGQWVNGLKCGAGEERYQNGDRYEGQFQAGCKNGDGIYYW